MKLLSMDIWDTVLCRKCHHVESKYGESKIKLYGYFRTVNKNLKNIKTEDTYKNLGIDHSLFFIIFIISVIERAIIEEVEVVYYFTREGEFFKQIHDVIERENVFGFPIPKAQVLEVSRMATFAPSIQEVNIHSIMRLWAQYPNQSLDAFFKSMNIPIKGYMDYLNKYDLGDIYTPIDKIYKNQSIINLFSDKEFNNKLVEEINKKRRLFLSYLNQKGVDSCRGKIFVVDIGWRGSIQDNIALTLPNTEIIGYYMGLYRPYYKDIPNSTKIGFIESNEENNFLWYFRQPYPIEMYTNSRNGSVVGYEESENGKIHPIRSNYHEEDIIFDKYVHQFQKGILQTIPYYGEMIRTYSLLSDELKIYAIKKFKNFIVKPNKDLAKPFFEMVDNNTFGIGKLEDMSKVLSFKLVLKSLVSPNIVHNLEQIIEDSNWAHGLFRYYHLDILNWIYCITSQKIYDSYSIIKPLKASTRRNLSLKLYHPYKGSISFKRESLVNKVKILYICGDIILPDEFDNDELEVWIQIEKKNKKRFYNTEQLIKNEQKLKNSFSFESKVFLHNHNKEVNIIVLNKDKLWCCFIKP